MSKTHSRFVTIAYGGQQVECSIKGASGIGVTYEEIDVTSLCNEIMEKLHGYGQVAVDVTGDFNNTATTGAHTIFQGLNGDPTGSTLTIQIGSNAAPTSGDPKFEVTNMGVFNYTVDVGSGSPSWSANLRPLAGATATWGTV